MTHKALKNGQTGVIHGVLALCQFIQDHNVEASFRGDLVVFVPRREQSAIDFARELSLHAANRPTLDPDTTETSMETRDE